MFLLEIILEDFFLVAIILLFIAYVFIKIAVTLSDNFKVRVRNYFGNFFEDVDSETSDYDESYSSEVATQQERNYFVYDGNNLGLLHFEINAILVKYFHYYKCLNQQLQQKFYNRLFTFLNAKQFVIHSNEPFKEMPVLISAAAVQISFGLDDFEFEHYDYIQVHKEEYFAQNSLRVLAGNVQGNCITLAWNHFLRDYKNFTDGNNVGLHEMAHALYFQQMVIDHSSNHFEEYFNELMNRGEAVLQQEKCPYNLYSAYAFSNLQEFWAVSVELFFERGGELKSYYPNVFDNLQNLLKQNPLQASNPLLN